MFFNTFASLKNNKHLTNMKNKITKRDIKFFIYGVLAILVIEIILDFDDVKRGWNDAQKDRALIENNTNIGS